MNKPLVIFLILSFSLVACANTKEKVTEVNNTRFLLEVVKDDGSNESQFIHLQLHIIPLKREIDWRVLESKDLNESLWLSNSQVIRIAPSFMHYENQFNLSSKHVIHAFFEKEVLQKSNTLFFDAHDIECGIINIKLKL